MKNKYYQLFITKLKSFHFVQTKDLRGFSAVEEMLILFKLNIKKIYN